MDSIDRRRFLRTTGAATATGLLAGPASAAASDEGGGDGGPAGSEALTEVASFPDQEVTGVAVTGDGRTFVNFPRFPWAVAENDPEFEDDAEGVTTSVGELRDDGTVRPYPNPDWNVDAWDQSENEWVEGEARATETFVCVQSVYADPDGAHLWALDTGNPEFEGLVSGGPKLVRIDLERDAVDRRYFLDREGANGADLTPERGPGAYLNDVRIDPGTRTAFLTDSNLGALLVLDLDTGRARRLMDDESRFPSTHAGQPIRIGPHEGQTEAYVARGTHSDGIAIDPERGELYYHALCGLPLYRVPTEVLRDFDLSDAEVADRVENLGETDATDGMMTDGEGHVYHTALSRDAISRWNAEREEVETLVQSECLKWPDTLAFGPEGDLYVTTSKIHLEATGTRRKPFKLFRIDRGTLALDGGGETETETEGEGC